MKRSITLALLLLALHAAFAATYTVADIPDVHRADRNAFVANPDSVLDAASVAEINSRLQALRRTTSVEAMVVAVDNIEPTDIDAFATELFQHWGLGKTDKDNGLLILIARDMRKVAIRPGYGLEGVLPDITCGRIIRDCMAPEFRQERYGLGTAAAVGLICNILQNPEHAQEYLSTLDDADDAKQMTGDDAFGMYIGICGSLALFLLVILVFKIAALRGRSRYDKYVALEPWRPTYLALTFLGLGMPAIASIPLCILLGHWRNSRRACPNCGSTMQKVDEVHDNDYLTPAQDLEERVGSVDYDVWLCPHCHETDILPYINQKSVMVECDRCHARTAVLRVDRIMTAPTAHSHGKGVKEYECLNCHNRTRRFYDIEPKPDVAAGALAAGAILGSMSRGSGGFGGGGSFGGGFGGGSTGGGGASGGW